MNKINDKVAQDIRAKIVNAGLFHSIGGYEMAQTLLAKHYPDLSTLQRKTIAGHLNQ